MPRVRALKPRLSAALSRTIPPVLMRGGAMETEQRALLMKSCTVIPRVFHTPARPCAATPTTMQYVKVVLPLGRAKRSDRRCLAVRPIYLTTSDRPVRSVRIWGLRYSTDLNITSIAGFDDDGKYIYSTHQYLVSLKQPKIIVQPENNILTTQIKYTVWVSPLRVMRGTQAEKQSPTDDSNAHLLE